MNVDECEDFLGDHSSSSNVLSGGSIYTIIFRSWLVWQSNIPLHLLFFQVSENVSSNLGIPLAFPEIFHIR